MDFNFNFPTNYSFKSKMFQLPTVETKYTSTEKDNPTFYTPSYSTKAKSASLFDTVSLITSLKEKFFSKRLMTYGDITLKSEPVLKKDTPLTLDEDFTVMQNYGIVCPKDTKDSEIKEAKYLANYGIVCPPKEEETTKPQETKFRSDDTKMYANYGIVCSPVEEDTSKSSTKFRSDDTKMYANYGIVCPNDL